MKIDKIETQDPEVTIKVEEEVGEEAITINKRTDEMIDGRTREMKGLKRTMRANKKGEVEIKMMTETIDE